jgi:uncharacterized protein
MPSRSQTLTYPRTPINTVNRYSVRETYDLALIHEIINTSTVLHISLNAPSSDPNNAFPICLPMIGVAASYEHPSAGLDEPLDVYVHGYVSARMMNLTRAADTPSTTTAAEDANGPTNTNTNAHTNSTPTQRPHEGLPVTVSATKVDGLILTLTPYTHDINYRSATLFGFANVVSNPDEKLWAMQQITNSVVGGRWRHARVPPTSAELSSTAILRVRVVGGSGKVRVGGPRDEKKDVDMLDEEGGGLWREKVWTGVVPVWEHFGDPITVGEGEVEEVPGHVREFVGEVRKRNEGYSLGAVRDQSQD